MKFWLKKFTNFFAWEEDRVTSVDSNFKFCVDVHLGLDPSPVDMRPPEPDPLCVDVINGWPLTL